VADNFIPESMIISRLQAKEISLKKIGSNKPVLLDPDLALAALSPCDPQNPLEVLLTVQLLGEKILGVEIKRGYTSHGLEENLARQNFSSGLDSMFRLKPELPIFYQIVFLHLLEKIHDVTPSEPEALKRAVAMEMGRIAHHLQVLSNIFFCLNLDSLVTYALELKAILAPLMPFFNPQNSTTEEPSHALVAENMIEILTSLNELEMWATEDPTIQKALRGKAALRAPKAAASGLTGLFLRSCNDDFDVRKKTNSRLYYPTRPRPCLNEEGDAFGRTVLRLWEMMASAEWIRDQISLGKVPNYQAIDLTLPELANPLKRAMTFAEVESPEGLLKIGIFFDEQNESYCYRLRTPAYFIAQIIPQILAQESIHNLPVLLHSLGISASEFDK
jgi:NADH-quinone oxidoreductase subunit D